MNIDTSIKGSVIPIQELKPIRITNDKANRKVLVAVSVGAIKLVEDVFYAGLILDVDVDIRNIIAPLLAMDDSFLADVSLDCPVVSRYQSGSAIQITMSVTETHILDSYYGTPDDTATFVVTSAKSSGRFSDIEELTVPKDYMMPMLFPASYLDTDGKTSLRICNIQQGITVQLPEDEDERSESAMVDTIFRIDAIPVLDGMELTAEVFDSSGNGKDSISLPALHVSSKPFEQYLFRNRYGGLDNIPMSGARKFTPEYSFEVGTVNSRILGITSGSGIKTFSQDTGYLPRQTMRALSELLLSDDIYHLKDGVFRKIVITGSTLNLSSAETVHSATFTYRYSDESDPVALI